MLSNIFDRISFWSLFAVIVGLPIFFLPFMNFSIESSKGLLVVVGLSISAIFWSAARLSEGKITIPKSNILLAGLGILFAVLLSSILSPSASVSFFGVLFDVGTFYSILAGVLLMFMSSVFFMNTKNINIVLLGVLASSALSLLFQFFFIFFPETLSMGVLLERTSNFLGSWNAFGFFASLACLIALFMLEFFFISKYMQWGLGVLVALSIILIATVNYSLVWILLGIFALVIFAFKIHLFSDKSSDMSSGGGEEQTEKSIKNFPVVSFTVVLISLFFIMSGNLIGNFLPSQLGLSNTEIRPSFKTTMDITAEALREQPLLGAGPNRFSELWSMYKPPAINNTQFWNLSFNSGSGVFPTLISTTGILGTLAFIAFFALLFVKGVNMILLKKSYPQKIQSIFFFCLSIYLLSILLFYSTGIVIFLLFFAFVGAFIGTSYSNKSDEKLVVSFLGNQKKSLIFIFSLVLIMIISAAVGFKYIERFVSVHYFQKALLADNIDNSKTAISKAISLYPNDLYLRIYSSVHLIELNSFTGKEADLTESEKTKAQLSFDQALSGALLAVDYSDTNYLNYKTLGDVYGFAVLSGIADAKENAIQAYTNASKLNPLNPELKLIMARVLLASGDTVEAKQYIKEAISLKRDYVDALITASQVAQSEGNTTEALSQARLALSFDPQNKNILQYIDSLNKAPVNQPQPQQQPITE